MSATVISPVNCPAEEFSNPTFCATKVTVRVGADAGLTVRRYHNQSTGDVDGENWPMCGGDAINNLCKGAAAAIPVRPVPKIASTIRSARAFDQGLFPTAGAGDSWLR
jgi:hypothetical protein